MPEPTSPAAGRHERLNLGAMFLRWYFLERPKEIIHSYRAYAAAFLEVFAFVFLLRTLISPWKDIKDSYPKKGFSLSAIMETLTLNITTRAIGSVVRIFAIIAGIIVQIALLAGFLVYGLIWLLFPFLVIAGIPALLAFSL